MDDLFGENRVFIPGNKPLEEAANLILHLVQYNPQLLDGDTMGQIDRQIMVEAWVDAGVLNVTDKASFLQFISNLPACYDTDVLRRARRWLLVEDKIRVSKEAILDADRQKSRLASNFRG